MQRATGIRLLILISLLMILIAVAIGREDNGFDLTGSLVPADQIHLGGPPRDGIPAIDAPVFVSAGQAEFLSDDQRVLGLAYRGQVRAYPISILNWHEVVNDRFGQEPVAISYCPLCGTGVAFAARSAAGAHKFGISGLLYNSDVLLYDRATESLWSQLLMQAVAGPLKGERLTPLPLSHTSWKAWRKQHPDTQVLSTDTGHARDYARDPYAGYLDSSTLYFPVSSRSRRYHPKERVLGVEIDGQFKAYPFSELSRSGSALVTDRVADRTITVRFDAEAQSAQAFAADGTQLAAVTGFWFAWYAFHPETEIYSVANRQ